MKRIVLLVRISLLISLITLSYNCTKDKGTEPDPETKPSGKIDVVSSSCDELWLNLSVENTDLPVNVTFYFETKPQKSFLLGNKDTTLYIDSLNAGRNYRSKFTFISGGKEITTDEYTYATLDTTSQNFTWQTYEFGELNNSILYDAAIIDENNIWAVGEIYMNDSSGNPDPKRYNAVHWDGTKWEMKRIYTYSSCSAIDYAPLKSIWAFSDNNIVVTTGGGIWKYNGNTFIADCGVQPLLTGAINKLWGTSSNNLYAVGNQGTIAHYNGTEWTKIESGTELDLVSIHPYGENEVLITGVNFNEVKGILLSGNLIKGMEILNFSRILDDNELFNPDLFGILSSVWVDENRTIYTGGNLLFRYKNKEWDYVRNLPENYIGGNPGVYYRGFIYSISGNKSNDYIIAGDRNTLRHYNGKNWVQLGMPFNPGSTISWKRVEQKGNTIIAVGKNGRKAFIIKLKR